MPIEPDDRRAGPATPAGTDFTRRWDDLERSEGYIEDALEGIEEWLRKEILPTARIVRWNIEEDYLSLTIDLGADALNFADTDKQWAIGKVEREVGERLGLDVAHDKSAD